jgi:glycosyltransferase involved in cell wall biosynthesis
MRRVRLLVASKGNEVMLDIASLIADGLTAHEVDTAIVIDELPPPATDDFVLVIAPHEFFPLFVEPLHGGNKRLDSLLPEVNVLNVEQPGSQWFELAWHYARRSRGLFDISSEGVREFARRGRVAAHLPLGFASSLMGPALLAGDRPIDVLFMGHLSVRREEFFARHAGTFSRHRCKILFSDVASPRTTNTAGYYAGRARLELFAASKIVLNVHSSDRPYFETHRALLALANRCLLVTEISRGTGPLISGRHFVMDTLDNMPSQCNHYLDHPEELSALASCGHDFVATRWRARDTCGALIDAVTTSVRGPVPANASSNDVSTDDTHRRSVIQRLAERRARHARGDNGYTIVDNNAYMRSGPPTVSVVVTLYDYATYIQECLDSVITSDPVPGGHEIVVVDDASTDRSRAVVESIMARAHIPIRLVKKTLNTGLADARNTGLELARGRAVFILDADNWIYPSCLRSLFEVLAQGTCAAAYPIIRKFSDQTGEPLGLLSARAWDVRSLIRGPYIDAMAMFDRDVVLSVGGYSTELIEHGWFGWEDYDLWLKLACTQQRCENVPSVLASYRVHSTSMLHRTNRSWENIAAYLRVKFRDLAAQYPDLDCHFGLPTINGLFASSSDVHFNNDEIYRQFGELQRQLKDVYASKSWRITRPLRWFYEVLTNWKMASHSG